MHHLLLVLVVLAAAPEPVSEVSGAVVLTGGGPLPDAVRDRFLELAGGPNARLVVISTSEAGFEAWKQKAASFVQLDAYDPEPLTTATGVWLENGSRRWSETELHKFLTRGGVVGGPAGEGLAFLPRTLVEPNVLTRNRVDRLLGALAKQPGHVGLGIDDETAVVVRGRRLMALGKSYVLICLPAGGGRPASVRVLKSGEQADLIALSRAAIVRSGPPFPPEKPQPPRLASGSLLIGGGGRMSEEIWRRFLDLAGGPDAPVVVVPTALEDPIPREPGEARALRRAGAKNVHVLHTRQRSVADTPEFVAPLREAKGVWFSGGRQWRFIDAYQGTAAEKAFHDVLARGGVIGGSSAGASIQSEYMPRGNPLGNLQIMAEGYEQGFAFLNGVAIDQHFFARRRQRDMTELMAAYPQLLGIGIDEGAVLFVHGSVMEVLGSGRVAVYDRRQPVRPGDRDYQELAPGSRYDLEKRRRVEPPQTPAP